MKQLDLEYNVLYSHLERKPEPSTTQGCSNAKNCCHGILGTPGSHWQLLTTLRKKWMNLSPSRGSVPTIGYLTLHQLFTWHNVATSCVRPQGPTLDLCQSCPSQLTPSPAIHSPCSPLPQNAFPMPHSPLICHPHFQWSTR